MSKIPNMRIHIATVVPLAALVCIPILYGQASPEGAVNSIAIRPDGITRLYGSGAVLDPGLKYQKGPNWIQADSAGSAKWEISSGAAGEYEVSLCYASKSEEVPIVLQAGDSSHPESLRRTSGVFQDDLMNFERVKLGGRLRLDPSTRSLILQLKPPSSIRLRSVELVPVRAMAAIEREAERARKARASTDWLAKAGYGVMFHWTSRSQPRNGPAKSYADAVAAFDVPAFGRMVEDTGAGYVIFTVNHAEPHCPAPIGSWERAHPGMTTRRDLIGEIADELGKRKIRLMLYFASHTLGGLAKSTAKEYWSIHEQVLTEFGKRYGARVAGYWFDGWYQTTERYPELSLDALWPIVKTGNPQRLVAYNFWLYPPETERLEYWAGEVGGVVKPADSRYMTSGPAKGLQYQALLFADAPWVHSKPDSEMEPLRNKDEQLLKFIQETMAKQGAVTVNLGVFQDGSIGPDAARQMEVVRRAVRGK
jgi:hypothetical protein